MKELECSDILVLINSKTFSIKQLNLAVPSFTTNLLLVIQQLNLDCLAPEK